MMKVLTLFLALFLTLMPESAPCYSSSPQWQDACVEEVEDAEEEAVIRTGPRFQKTIEESLGKDPGTAVRDNIFLPLPHSANIRFERHWLVCHRLRL